ncbi:MAG: alpha/beta fold hydrolase [Desulfovibrionaceae bacterium]
MATFVLVHGAFQGGWVWRDVARELAGMGHEAHTPTLSGCGHLHHGFRQGIDLHTYVLDVLNYLQFEALRDVVLVAHSYSGMVCGAVAMCVPHLIRRLVFADAVIPASQTSFAAMAGEAFRHVLDSHTVGGWKVKPWALPMFGVPESKAEWFGARVCEFPLAAFTEPLPGEFDPRVVDGACITCTNTANRFINAMADKAFGLGWPVSSLESNHSPMTTHPHELAVLLHETAREGAA